MAFDRICDETCSIRYLMVFDTHILCLLHCQSILSSLQFNVRHNKMNEFVNSI